IERGPTVLFIRSEGLIGTIEDIQNIVVKNLTNGTPLLIRDIAEVRLGSATRYGAMTYNGPEEVAGAVVMMLKGANSNAVIANIKEKIVQIEKTLPAGVMIDPFLDRTKMVNNAIGTVETNLLEGALIVVFVLVLFLGNLRAGFLVASIIPLAMLFAIIMMNLFGVSGNLMSLGALDFGLIVDGAVIIVEAVMHRLNHGKHFSHLNKLTQADMDSEVKQSASLMMNSAVFGQVIILIVYLPIFALQGIEGKMFKPMAQTVAFALLGAFILSLTYIPMMSALVLSKKITLKKTLSDKMMAKLEKSYQRILERSLKFSKVILAATVALFVIAAFVLTLLGGEFIPSLEEGDFAVETRVLPGSNLNTSMNAVSTGARILIHKFPEVEKIVGKTGSSEIPTDPMPVDASDMMVILKDKKHWTSAKTFPELEARMANELEAVPGVTFGFQYPVQMRFNELMTGARQDVVCKIFGEDLDTLAHFAKRLGDLSNTVKGSSGLYVETVTGMPQIVIEFNRAVIAQYGLNVSDINKIVNTAFAGHSSGLVYEGEKRFDLVVRLSGEKRKNVEDVQNLLIPTPQGTQIPLNQLAKVDIQEGPNQIQREDAQRRIIVGFNVRGRDVQSMVKELQQKVEQQIKLPPGYYITYGGAFENLEAAKKRLSIAVPVALILILLMLYFAFGSFKQGLIIYSAIPLSAIGGIFALAIRGMPFSISAGIGFIALFGVAVLNGIVLIAEFNRLKKEGTTDLLSVVTQGTKIRLRPVLMTAFVASLGFLPMALSNGAGAEVQRPLATVVIGGLMVATFLTLFVLPILYIMFEKRLFMWKKKPVVTGILFILISACSSPGMMAQTPISLPAAVDTALKNNLSLRSQQLEAEYLRKLTNTAYTIPQMNATIEYGQINSAYNDNRLFLTQSIKFPTVYKRQRDLYEQDSKSGQLNVAIRQTEIKKQVSNTYYQMVYLRQKQKLLQHTDSIFEAFLITAELRLKVGETNVLEKTTAESQRGQITIQLQELMQDFDLLQAHFNLLLNTSTFFVPADEDLKINAPNTIDTSMLQQHPFVKQLQQQQQISAAKLQLEKAKLSPDLLLGYNNTTIKGTGADGKVYSNSKRFQAVQFGVGIPLFRGAQKNTISAGRINMKVAEANYVQGLQQLKSSYHHALGNYNKSRRTVAYYESTGLKNAETIISTANIQFRNGEINYLEWVLLVNNAIAIQSQYIDAAKNLTESVIEITSFISQ
ncbi:MAG TPA: CusA/CzcA family heavy metal efflux RND transporter, partial [Flavitalea sp.]|nr:CusA/CzcA family heavy metal efflux RND transporter [Flavitalea sp.]